MRGEESDNISRLAVLHMVPGVQVLRYQEDYEELAMDRLASSGHRKVIHNHG